MNLLLTILLGLSLSMPTFAEDNLNSANNESIATADSKAIDITINDDNAKDDVGALVQTYYYNFGRTLLFTTKSVSFTLRNRRLTPLWIGNISIYGNGFAQRENCPEFLFFGQSCTVRIFFRPNHIGNFNGLLYINFRNSEDIQIFLYGRGVFNIF